MSDIHRDMATAIAPPTMEPLRLRQGVVSAVTFPTVTIKVGGSSVEVAGVAILTSYSPTAGDTIWILQAGPDLLVLGKKAVA